MELRWDQGRPCRWCTMWFEGQWIIDTASLDYRSEFPMVAWKWMTSTSLWPGRCFRRCVKKILLRRLDVNENNDLLTRLTRLSVWHRMKRSIAWILRLKPKPSKMSLRTKDVPNRVGRTSNLEDKPLRVEEVVGAEKKILKLVRSGAFPEEIEALRNIRWAGYKNDR